MHQEGDRDTAGAAGDWRPTSYAEPLPPEQPGERVWFGSPPDLDGVDLMVVRGSSRSWRAWHERYSLCVVYSITGGLKHGAARWTYRGEEHYTEPGQLMLMEPGECHITRKIIGAGDFDVFSIDRSIVERIAGQLGVPTPVHLRTACADDRILFGAAAALARGERCAEGPLAQQQRLVSLVTLLLERHGESNQVRVAPMNKVQVSRARDYILEHYADPFDLTSLVTACGASESSVCHGFLKAMGISPMRFRDLVRAEHAKRLLAQGVEVRDVASMVGYCDQPKLTHKIRSVFGVTPARLARMLRQ